MADAPYLASPHSPPLLVVLSGPSGVGKDAVISRLRPLSRPWHFVVTATTRPRRPSEVDGQDYIFLDRNQFQEMLSRGEFLEHAQVYGHLYGVPRGQVREALNQHHDVIMKIDVQGASTIKKLAPEAVFIFLLPGSMQELRQRLSQRHTESGIDLERRIQAAQKEMECIHLFDYQVLNRNGHIDQAVACIDAIITAERCRIPRRHIAL